MDKQGKLSKRQTGNSSQSPGINYPGTKNPKPIVQKTDKVVMH